MRFQSLHKVENFLFNHFLVVSVVNVVHPSVYHEDFGPFLTVNPLLVSLMDSLEVLETNVLLALPVPNLYSLLAYLRGAFQVDNTLDGTVVDQSVADRVVDFIFVGLKVSIFVHDFTEDVPVS